MLTIEDIIAALALPGDPGSDFDLNPGAVPPAVLRPAAVLCPLVDRGQGLRVVLTRRAEHLVHHPGQISFPGGKVDAADPSPLHAALREAREEVGLAEVRVLGALGPWRTSTGFQIAPFVGQVAPDWQAVPDPAEVAAVIEAPLDFLMDPANHQRHHREAPGGRRHFHAMPWDGHYIWGATAGMLRGLALRLARVRG